jgi:ABC-type multidrug transport system ATPase subunit
VLSELDLAIGEGEVFALLGRNGSGKSSLLRCLLGLQRATAGSLRLFGRDAWTHRHELMERVGYAPEEPSLSPAMSALDAARLTQRLRGRFELEAFGARLDDLGIDARRPFAELSRGQQSLVSLGLALATRAQLLVLDDPTLGLDAAARRAVWGELIDALAPDSEEPLKQESAGVESAEEQRDARQPTTRQHNARQPTILIASHDLAGVEAIATHVGVLCEGRLVLPGELETLKARFARVSLPASQRAWLEHERFRVWSQRHVAWGFEAVLEGDSWDDLPANAEVAPMRLEEIFLAVTGAGSGTGRDATDRSLDAGSIPTIHETATHEIASHEVATHKAGPRRLGATGGP